MDELWGIVGVDIGKAAAIAGATGWLTDVLKIRLGWKGRGVQLLAFFVALVISIAWIVPWSQKPVGGALFGAVVNAGLTSVAAIFGAEMRSLTKDKKNKETEQ